LAGQLLPVQHDGANLGISVVVQDITERKRMEAKIRKNEAILARAQRISHLGSWEMEFLNPADFEECEMHWSDEMYRILGYGPGEIPVARATLYKAVHPQTVPPYQMPSPEPPRTQAVPAGIFHYPT